MSTIKLDITNSKWNKSQRKIWKSKYVASSLPKLTDLVNTHLPVYSNTYMRYPCGNFLILTSSGMLCQRFSSFPTNLCIAQSICLIAMCVQLCNIVEMITSLVGPYKLMILLLKMTIAAPVTSSTTPLYNNKITFRPLAFRKPLSIIHTT